MPEGVSLLLSVLGDPALQKSSKAWYLLRVQALQVLAFYLSLSANVLPSALREQLWDQGERGAGGFRVCLMVRVGLLPSLEGCLWSVPRTDLPVVANGFHLSCHLCR